MDYFQQDCAHVANQFEPEPASSTKQDKTTHRRWAQAVAIFYACVVLAGVAAIGVTQHNATEQHASLAR
jgi:hypothetical protein